MTNVEVQYEDGKKENLSINSPLRANSETKVVHLGSDDKKLDKITFNFRKDEMAKEDKAKVELWGLKADDVSGMGKRDIDAESKSDDASEGTVNPPRY